MRDKSLTLRYHLAAWPLNVEVDRRPVGEKKRRILVNVKELERLVTGLLIPLLAVCGQVRHQEQRYLSNPRAPKELRNLPLSGWPHRSCIITGFVLINCFV